MKYNIEFTAVTRVGILRSVSVGPSPWNRSGNHCQQDLQVIGNLQC